jgi:hypothetical protein
MSAAIHAHFSQIGERLGPALDTEKFLEHVSKADREQQARDNLKKIDHIVILVQPNRHQWSHRQRVQSQAGLSCRWHGCN